MSEARYLVAKDGPGPQIWHRRYRCCHRDCERGSGQKMDDVHEVLRDCPVLGTSLSRESLSREVAQCVDGLPAPPESVQEPWKWQQLSMVNQRMLYLWQCSNIGVLNRQLQPHSKNWPRHRAARELALQLPSSPEEEGKQTVPIDLGVVLRWCPYTLRQARAVLNAARDHADLIPLAGHSAPL